MRQKSSGIGNRPCLLIALFLAIVPVACTPARGEKARAQVAGVVEHLKAGRLAEAYSESLPAMYDRELNDVLSRARKLITAEEYQIIRNMASRAGGKLSSFLGKDSPPGSLRAVIAEKAKDLPAALGLESHEVFQTRDVKGILQALDRGIFADLSRTEEVRSRLGTVEVALLEAKGDWARLRFSSRDSSGGETQEAVDLIEIEGKWVPDSWVTEFPVQMDALRKRIQAAEEMKKQNPDILKQALATAGLALESPGPLLESLFSLLGTAAPAKQPRK